MSIVGLDHVQLAAPAGCEAAARRFFGGLLGLAELDKPDALRARGGAWFALGPHQLHVGVAPAPFVAAMKAHPALVCDDLDALAVRLADAGAPVIWDEAIAGRRRFSTADPWGNRIELISPAASPR